MCMQSRSKQRCCMERDVAELARTLRMCCVCMFECQKLSKLQPASHGCSTASRGMSAGKSACLMVAE